MHAKSQVQTITTVILLNWIVHKQRNSLRDNEEKKDS